MKVFVCLDDKNGMMFNKRRQSKDRNLIGKVKEIVRDETIFVSEYTNDILPDGTICNDFGTVKGFVFVEDPIHLFEDKIETLYIFKWNRHYPSDKKFNLDMKKFALISVENFVGYSHENITLEVYKKRGC